MKTKVVLALVLVTAMAANAAEKVSRDLEGPVQSISSTQITVNDSRAHGPVTATIDINTVMRQGAWSVAYFDVQQGDRVHVKARVNADGTLTAEMIMVREPR